MKIVMLLGRSTGGIAGHVAELSAHLRDRGEDLLVVTDPLTARRFDPRLVRLWWPESGGWFRKVSHLGRLRGLASTSDVLHAHGLRAGALGVAVARSLPRERRPRVVVTLHNLPIGGRSMSAASAVLERVVARGADAVLGVSGDLVERAVASGARHTARALVPAPARPPTRRTAVQVRAELGLSEDGALLVTVARLAPQKGLDLLCDTALLLKQRLAAGDLPGIATLTWVVAGDGPLAEHLAGRIEDQGLPVVALGRRDDVPDLLAAADLVVSAAVWEGQPIWLQEALWLGAAIVATDVGGTHEVTGEGASLVAAGNPAYLAGAIVDLLTDEPRREALRHGALERAQVLPTMSDAVSQLIGIYAREAPGDAADG
ncbi:MAG: glycosyltransferase family 4 protein [Dermatophilaceae bacterium]